MLYALIPESFKPERVQLELAARISSIVAGYWVMDTILDHVGRLPQEAYTDPVIVTAVPSRIVELTFRFPATSLSVAICVSLLVFYKPSLTRHFLRWCVGTWTKLGIDPKSRNLVLILVAILAWSYSTYGYNYLVNQGHGADRILLLLLAAAIWWRPIFLVPFVFQLKIILGQMQSTAALTVPALLSDILLIVAMGAAVGYVGRKFPKKAVLAVVLSALASYYFASGIGKLRIDWLQVSSIHYFLAKEYSGGWLGFLDMDTMSKLIGSLALFNVPMKILTIALECGVLLIMVERRVATLLLTGLIGMHLGILVVSGFFFWKWICAELAIIWLWLRDKTTRTAFNKTSLAFSLAVIICGGFIFAPSKLAWIDLPLDYTYTYYGIGASGQKYVVPYDFFSPHYYKMRLFGLHYMVHDPRLPSTGRQELASRVDIEDFEKLEAQSGVVAFDELRRTEMVNFLTTFIRHSNERIGHQHFPSKLAPPVDLLSTPAGQIYEREEPLAKLEIIEITSQYDGVSYRRLRTRLIETIDLPLGDRRGRSR